MNQALWTQIPQIGDSSQQLLARMAAAAADQNQQTGFVTWLPSNTRNTGQLLTLAIPQGVLGIQIRLNVTSVPGVDTLRLRLLEPFYGWAIVETANAATPLLFYICCKQGSQINYPTGTPLGVSVGILPSVAILIEHSGAGNFVYSASYQFLKK